MDTDRNKERISYATRILMLGTALFYDVLQALITLIPFVGTVLAYLIVGLSFLTYFVWFKIHNVGFFERFGARKIVAYIGVPIIEILTLGVAPGITIVIAITIAIVRTEDKLVSSGAVTREELKYVQNSVMKIAQGKGFDSIEFKQALSQSLGRRIEDRYQVDQKVQSIKKRGAELRGRAGIMQQKYRSLREGWPENGEQRMLPKKYDRAS